MKNNMFFSKYTFDNFVVGESNEFAYDMVLAVAEGTINPCYSPLYIYSKSGLGKTHLLHAVRQRVEEKYPDREVLYVVGNKLLDDLIYYIKQGNGKEFQKKYTSPDILLIDDVQLLSGKPTVQEEVLHIYNTLREQGKLIIITSDKPVTELYEVTDTLKTRFISGLQIEIKPPNKALRTEVLKIIATRLNVLLPDDVINYIAENVDSNIRQLEGAVKIAMAYKNRYDKDIDIESAKDIFNVFEANNVSAPHKIRYAEAVAVLTRTIETEACCSEMRKELESAVRWLENFDEEHDDEP